MPGRTGCVCNALSICLDDGGGVSCFAKWGCQSIEAEVENCIEGGGGHSCVKKFCHASVPRGVEHIDVVPM